MTASPARPSSGVCRGSLGSAAISLEFLPGSQRLYLQETGTGRRDAPAAPTKPSAASGAGRCPRSPGAGQCLRAAAWGLGELHGPAPAAVSLPVYLVIPRDLLYPFTLSSRRTKHQTPGDLGLPLTLVVHHWLGHSGSACVYRHEACSAGSPRIKQPKRLAGLESREPRAPPRAAWGGTPLTQPPALAFTCGR